MFSSPNATLFLNSIALVSLVLLAGEAYQTLRPYDPVPVDATPIADEPGA